MADGRFLAPIEMGGLIVGGYLLLMNAFAFLQFGRGRHRARLGLQRIPEASLLAVAACGGSIVAKLGQRYFRHKTYKMPFARQFDRILI